MDPSILQGLPGPPLPPQEGFGLLQRLPTAPGKRGAVLGGPSTVSLRVGMLGWYFGLKQVQLDLLQWIRVSLELLADFCCCWVQSAVLACTMLLLLAWKLHAGARNQGQKTLQCVLALRGQLSWGLSLLQSCGCYLETLVVWVVWWPARCFIKVIGCIARALEVLYVQAGRIAEEEEREEAVAAVPPTSAFLQK